MMLWQLSCEKTSSSHRLRLSASAVLHAISPTWQRRRTCAKLSAGHKNEISHTCSSQEEVTSLFRMMDLMRSFYILSRESGRLKLKVARSMQISGATFLR